MSRQRSLLAALPAVIALAACADVASTVAPPPPRAPVVPIGPSGGVYALVELAVGMFHTCALDRAGKAYCWGRNDVGQLGSGAPRQAVLSPVPVAGGLTFRALYAGGYHSCGIADDGYTYCWGLNDGGQLGIGTTAISSGGCHDSFNPHICLTAPMQAGGSLRFTTLSLGNDGSCGVAESGATYCWGFNVGRELGFDSDERCVGFFGAESCAVSPRAVTGEPAFVAVSQGGAFSCGLTLTMRAHCWGWNIGGQLGIGSSALAVLEGAVAGGLGFTRLSTGSYYACGVATDQRAYCWGSSTSGQLGAAPAQLATCPLGAGTTPCATAPTPVATELRFASISAGRSDNVIGAHTCALALDARAYCWGLNLRGQLGAASTEGCGDDLVNGVPFPCATAPLEVSGGHRWAEVQAGYDHSCGITREGDVYCWGDDTFGQLGNGTRYAHSQVPVKVALP